MCTYCQHYLLGFNQYTGKKVTFPEPQKCTIHISCTCGMAKLPRILGQNFVYNFLICIFFWKLYTKLISIMVISCTFAISGNFTFFLSGNLYYTACISARYLNQLPVYFRHLLSACSSCICCSCFFIYMYA